MYIHRARANTQTANNKQLHLFSLNHYLLFYVAVVDGVCVCALVNGIYCNLKLLQESWGFRGLVQFLHLATTNAKKLWHRPILHCTMAIILSLVFTSVYVVFSSTFCSCVWTNFHTNCVYCVCVVSMAERAKKNRRKAKLFMKLSVLAENDAAART